MSGVLAFVASSRYEPSAAAPNVVVPFTNEATDPATHRAMRLNLHMQGLRPRMEPLHRTLDAEFAYDRLIRRLWAEGDRFVIVEHDILPWPGAIAQLWECPEAWCAFPYLVHGEIRAYLGCVMFDPSKLGDVPLPDLPVLWSELDVTIIRALSARGIEGHLHGPAVSHLNFWHQRMSEQQVTRPDWMG